MVVDAKSGMVAEHGTQAPAAPAPCSPVTAGAYWCRPADGVVRCGLLGRKQRVVCGDRVTWGYPPAADGPSVESIEPRRNLIERIDARGRAEPVAANIDRLAIVAATQPAPDWFLVDRYWAGAVLKELDALLIVNKSDLGTEAIQAELEDLPRIALELRRSELPIRSRHGRTQKAARRLCDSAGRSVGRRQILAGQRTRARGGGANRRTDPRCGRAAHHHDGALVSLGASASLVDAPGVRDFAPPASLVRAAERGFVEIHARSAQCRFNDCRHMEEPGCAVRTAVINAEIAARRYESYRRLFRLYEKLAS